MLIEAMRGVRDKTLEPHQGKAIAMLAAQVNASLMVELEARKREAGLDQNGNPLAVGALALGRAE